MPIPVVLFLIGFGILMISPFILMFTKAHYHFYYLKKLNPEKLKKYDSFFDTMKIIQDNRIVFYNKYIALVCPFFKRYPELENTEELIKLGRKVEQYCKLIYGDIAFIVLTVTLLIVFFGDSN